MTLAQIDAAIASVNSDIRATRAYISDLKANLVGMRSSKVTTPYDDLSVELPSISLPHQSRFKISFG